MIVQKALVAHTCRFVAPYLGVTIVAYIISTAFLFRSFIFALSAKKPRLENDNGTNTWAEVKQHKKFNGYINLVHRHNKSFAPSNNAEIEKLQSNKNIIWNQLQQEWQQINQFIQAVENKNNARARARTYTLRTFY